MAELLEQRLADTKKRLGALRDSLQKAEKICTAKACVYAIGSFGRGEASPHSDLDLFIVGKGTEDSRRLTKLDEIIVKAELIEATARFGIPEFSGDGEYLDHYSIQGLTGKLGTPDDDASNTFTARLLLLLESKPLLEDSVYRQVIDEVIAKYWRDYEDQKNDFMPAFLTNDILRLWRTFCVNYEARTTDDPPPKKAKRKLKNYKLKHSRLLTCYSALLYLLAIHSQQATVSPEAARAMVLLSPTGRLAWILAQKEFAHAHPKVEQLITSYESFLKSTDAPEEKLIDMFLDKKKTYELFKSAYNFGDLMSEVLDTLGKTNRFYRLLVV